MEYVSKKDTSETSVHEWKPCTPERYVMIMHDYVTRNIDKCEGLRTRALDLDDRGTRATIFSALTKEDNRYVIAPDPVLMTISNNEGKVITFESIVNPYSSSKNTVTGSNAITSNSVASNASIEMVQLRTLTERIDKNYKKTVEMMKCDNALAKDEISKLQYRTDDVITRITALQKQIQEDQARIIATNQALECRLIQTEHVVRTMQK